MAYIILITEQNERYVKRLDDTLSLKVLNMPGNNIVKPASSYLALARDMFYFVSLQPLSYLFFSFPNLHCFQDDVSVGFRIGSD